MPAALLDSGTFAFTDGGAGHVCDLGAAPAAGDLDVLCVNSDTVVSTPSGFTLAATAVSSQGSYLYYRIAAGSESSTVTVTTSGDHPAQVSWSRWSGVAALDVAAQTTADGINDTTTPAHSTGALAEADELVIAFAALHGLGTPVPGAPTWSAGYTGLTSVIQGTGSTGVRGYVGYRTDAGPTAETPSVSWADGPASDRYMLTVAFTAAGAPAEATAELVATAPAATLVADAQVTAGATLTGAAPAATLTAAAVVAATAALTGTAPPAAITANATVEASAGLVATAPAARLVLAQVSTGADLDIRVGPPTSAWRAGPPTSAWRVDPPRSAWTIGQSTG